MDIGNYSTPGSAVRCGVVLFKVACQTCKCSTGGPGPASFAQPEGNFAAVRSALSPGCQVLESQTWLLVCVGKVCVCVLPRARARVCVCLCGHAQVGGVRGQSC